MNLVMIAKSKFKKLLKNKFASPKGSCAKQASEIRKRKHEMMCNTVIEKCYTLQGLNPIMRQSLYPYMKFVYMNQGDVYRFKNFPGLGLFVMAEGRMEVRWFHLKDVNVAQEACVKETLFIRDYLDYERITRLYPEQGIVENTGVCLSQNVVVCEIDPHVYEQHYRMNEKFNKLNLN